jgi:heptosyltransferase-2
LLAPSFSSALTLWLSGVRIRVGYANDGRRALLSDALPARGLREEHVADNYARLGARLMERLGKTLQPGAAPSLSVFDDERRRIRSRLDELGVVGSQYAVVVPGATYGPTKSWPVDKYRALVAQLSEKLPVVLAGGQQERALCESVRGDADSVVNLAGATALGELFALVEGARAVVANDSGVPHVAGSLGTPAVVIFGSTSPTWTQPLGDDVRVVREPVHCSPCFLRECPTQLECYQGITVERVLEAVDASSGDAMLVANAGRRDGERT